MYNLRHGSTIRGIHKLVDSNLLGRPEEVVPWEYPTLHKLNLSRINLPNALTMLFHSLLPSPGYK